MPSFTSPEVVVQRQLDAYNAKDLDAWLSTYAEDAKQFELGGGLLAHGHEAIRARRNGVRHHFPWLLWMALRQAQGEREFSGRTGLRKPTICDKSSQKRDIRRALKLATQVGED
jgi:ketosteroid isomerase-like protein